MLLGEQVLEGYPKVMESKNHLMDNDVLERIFHIIAHNMNSKRPVFEVVRRCIELIDQRRQKNKKINKGSSKEKTEEGTKNEASDAVFKSLIETGGMP